MESDSHDDLFATSVDHLSQQQSRVERRQRQMIDMQVMLEDVQTQMDKVREENRSKEGQM